MLRSALRVVLAGSLVLACRSPADAGPEDKDSAQSEPVDDAASPSLPDNPFAGIASMLKNKLDEPGPYDEPKQSAEFDDKAAHWDVVELGGSIVEVPAMSLFGGAGGTKLRDITDYLDRVAASEETAGVLLRLDGVSVDMARGDELRQHLLAFTRAGKKLHCHAENYSNASYYLATACDRVAIAPLGAVQTPGPAAEPIHVKGLLDRLGVKADFLHVGAFKGAAEPLTLDEPSDQMRETLQAILDDAYDTMISAMVEGRGIDSDAAKAAIDRGFVLDHDAVAAKLADEVSTFEAFRAGSVGDAGWHAVKIKSKGGPDFDDPLALQRFIGILPPEVPGEPHVALVYAIGTIVDGKGGGTIGAREGIASRPLAAALRAIAADDTVAAVVLRVDSPGGSALASDLIHEATLELREKKPLIVSMGSVAASGGYYISAGATKIFADANTLTGSIGVVGGKIVLGEAMESVGVKTFGVKKGERGLMWSSSGEWTTSEREAVYGMMETTYERFVARVVAGRSMERDAVHAVAQGRVWTGRAAKERGLVDEIGGLDAALAAAHEAGGIDPAVGLEVYPPQPNLRDIIGTLDVGVIAPNATQLALSALAEVAPEVARDAARMVETTLALRDARVWAVEWLRPAR